MERLLAAGPPPAASVLPATGPYRGRIAGFRHTPGGRNVEYGSAVFGTAGNRMEAHVLYAGLGSLLPALLIARTK
jgi:hypothetical protein